MPATAAAISARTAPHAAALIAAVCAALFIEAMNLSMVSVLLPSIQRDLGLSIALLQWLHGAFILGFGGFLLLGGRVADLYGRRRTFVAGVTVFGLGAVAAALASSAAPLLAARAVQGIAAAFMVPAAVSILTTTFPEGPARTRALGAFNAAGAAGFSAGLVFGGLITEAVGWQAAFLVNAPIAGLIVLAILIVAPLDPTRTGPRRLDWPGAVAGTFGLGLLLFAITEATELGLSARTLGAGATGALALGLFLHLEARSAAPLMPLGVFRRGSVAMANLASLTLLGAFFGVNFVLPLLLQRGLGWSPAAAGAALLPMSLLCVFVAQVLTPRLIDRFASARVAAAGLAAIAAGALVLALGGATPSYGATVLPGTLLVGGVGVGLAYAALAVAALGGVPNEDQGLVSGLQQTSLQIGGALGVALSVLAMETTSMEGFPYAPALLVSAAIAGLGVILVLRIKEHSGDTRGA